MADITAALLARRQKDLGDYDEENAMRLEVMTRNASRDLDKHWTTLAAKLKAQVKQLYDDADAITDPRKLATIGNKAARLEIMIDSLQEDIRLSGMAQQPYTTDILINQFEDSYYFTGYGLEQAAKVAAVIPILTPAQVLGVIANPWVGDGNNYSKRITVNMAYFADKIKASVTNAVNEGWGWNKTALEIQANTGEGRFKAVRLARTELTRASAQGSSYSYMDNSDILDGKRWNATKDSRTAPKDAANDAKHYDLDYDTMENPGVPGQRIPNHAHCRCLWSPILSALGVQDKERIARDDTDTPSSWGKNYYTKAANYKEYAKERGLPDLEARLAKDNPKAYLRAGETVADINKKVTRWSGGTGAITIAKPLWEQAQKNPNQDMTATWESQIKDQIAKGVNTEAEVSAVGKSIREKMQSATVALEQQADALLKEGDAILDDMNIKQYQGADYDAKLAEYRILSDKREALNMKRWADKKDTLRETLSTIRPMGPAAGSKQLWSKGTSTEVKKSVETVRNYFPTDWISKSDLEAMKGKKVARGSYMEADLKNYVEKGYTLEQLTRWKALDRINAQIKLSGTYKEDGGGSMLRVAFHEMGHRMEDMIPAIKKMEHEFYTRRTKGENLKWLGPGYKQKEVTRKDNFLSSYMGKDYGNKENSFHELVSMGMESLFQGSYDLDKDTDYYDFILGVIAAL